MNLFKNIFTTTSLLALAILTAFTSDSHAEEARLWTHTNGKSVYGRMLKYNSEVIVIEIGDKEATINWENLSPKDRKYLIDLDKKIENPKNRLLNKIYSSQDEKGKAQTQLESFIQTVNTYAQKHEASSNDLQKANARTERANALKKLFPDREFTNWTGKIITMQTDSNRNAVIRILIESNDVNTKIVLQSYPIAHDSEIYHLFSPLSVNDKVSVSGSFVGSRLDFFMETSFTERGSMTKPEFVIKISDVSKIPADK